MDANIEQRNFWEGDFGDNFVERMKTEDIARYKRDTGTTYKEIFYEFFENLNRDLKIIELGCNIGVNLATLKDMGFTDLHGVEINHKAYEIGKKNNPSINFINSSIEDFNPNQKYDIVFTAGVLIHINPAILNSVIEKMVNLSSKYIFGFEYYSDELVEIPYRSHSQRCWKQNFPLLFKKLFPDLQIVKQKKIPYLNSQLSDIVYLIEK